MEINNIVVFDSLSSTLILECLEKKVPFIFILESINFSNLTSSHDHYLKKMLDSGMIIIENDKNKLKKILFDLKKLKKEKIDKIIELNSQIIFIGNKIDIYKKDYLNSKEDLILP